MNGTYLGLFPIDDGWLNICLKSKTNSKNAFKFSRIYSQKCQIDIYKILQWYNGFISEKFKLFNYETIFQELYLRFNTINGEQKVKFFKIILNKFLYLVISNSNH